MIACTLRLYNSIDKTISSLAKTLCLVCRGISDALKPPTYVFFENIPTPYRLSSVKTYPTASAVGQWYYLPENKYFVQCDLGFYGNIDPDNLKSLPLLSMEIVHNNLTLHDLTDFIGDIKVYSNDNTFPSISHILGAWSLNSGIVVSQYEEFIARMIDTSANTLEVPVCNYDFLASEATPDTEEDQAVEAVEAPVVEAPVVEAPVVEAPVEAPVEAEAPPGT
jgi:hypothetical protein